jgi:hypothetical protein
MNSLRMIILAGCLSCSAANAATTTIGGTVTINITGVFSHPVNFLHATVNCKAIVSLVPNNLNTALGSFSLGTILNHLGEQSASAVGGFVPVPPVRTFTCSATVIYRWENIDPTVFKMAIAYYVTASDPGFPVTFPGKKLEVIETIPIPAAGTTTTLRVTPRL